MPERRTAPAAAGPGAEGACLFSGSAGIPMHCALSSHWTQVACGGLLLASDVASWKVCRIFIHAVGSRNYT